eukprot:TRINITY_DN12881_c0_g1_i1.p1 TRINITY_DN12881_c0_g1~~TRINITY_DN12881_c0_g1_i1.p1  ORF type:complete len:370 (-),score=65.69 TRINITY_DN12881_c0_g1_i1:154-1263(-)
MAHTFDMSMRRRRSMLGAVDDQPEANAASSSNSSNNGAPARGSLTDSSLLVPLMLLVASAVVCAFPEKGIAVVLLLCALSSYGPTSEPVVSCLIETMERAVQRGTYSQQLRACLQHEMCAVLCDPRMLQAFTDSSKAALQETMVSEASQSAMVACCVKVVRDGELKTLLKDSILESMQDDELRCATTASITKAAITASQDQDLQSALNIAGRNAVREALCDESLIRTLFGVLQEGLRDPGIHSAALKGALSTINPLKSNPISSLKGVSSSIKKSRVDVEAAALANASGLTRAPPPTLGRVSESLTSSDSSAGAPTGTTSLDEAHKQPSSNISHEGQWEATASHARNAFGDEIETISPSFGVRHHSDDSA